MPAVESLEQRVLFATFTVLNSGDAGADTFRQAILDANASEGADTIVFAESVVDTITLASSLQITDDLTITGPGAGTLTISGNNAVRVLNIDANLTVNISGLTIANGSATQGGGIYSDRSTLTLEGVTLSSNTASAAGGGLFAYGGDVTIEASTFSSNSVTSNSGDLDYGGGGMFFRLDSDANASVASFTITDSTFSDNTVSAGHGGGLSVDVNSTGATDLTVTGTISGSTFARNGIGNGSGGGIWNLARVSSSGSATADLSITNTTIHDNLGLLGGGLGNYLSLGNGSSGDVTATVFMLNCTVVGNLGQFEGGGLGRSASLGSGSGNWTSTITIQNTIVASNTTFDFGPDVFQVNSGGHNLIGRFDGFGDFVHGQNGDMVGSYGSPINPRVGSLSDNGGPTQTLELLSDSPAIDNGNADAAPATDQRGYVRTAPVDIGAFEYNAAPPPVNTDPNAQDFVVTYLPGASPVIDALAQADDADEDSLTLSILTDPLHGTAVIDDNETPADPSDDTIVYTPYAGHYGTDSFTYQVDDGAGGMASATVTINPQGAALLANPNTPELTDLIVVGTNDDDTINLSSDDGQVLVDLNGDEQSFDAPTGRILVFGLNGNDTLDAVHLSQAATLWGGAGDDTLIGGDGADVLLGGAGSNTILSGDGDKTLAVNGDFDGDGTPDILWRDGNANTLWLMDGIFADSAHDLPTTNFSDWQIRGAGDFNGDGYSDILWRRGNQNALWYMQGSTRIGWAHLPSTNFEQWMIAGVGDLNGDGRVDILWRRIDTGQNAVWFMRDSTRIGYAFLDTELDDTWWLVGTGDFDADGRDDLLWQNTDTSDTRTWIMDGVTYRGTRDLPPASDIEEDGLWVVMDAGDYDADGMSDLRWYDQDGGSNAVWLLNGFDADGFSLFDEPQVLK